jgi:hypothetical protein
MTVLNRKARERAAEGMPRANRRLAAERAAADAGQRACERLEAEVDAEMLAELEQRRAEAKLTPQELVERRIRALATPLAPADVPRLPPYRQMAREAVLTRWREQAAQERRERERKLGIPEQQAKYDAAMDTIRDRQNAATTKENERLASELRAIAERANTERADLGERPSLDAIEVTA